MSFLKKGLKKALGGGKKEDPSQGPSGAAVVPGGKYHARTFMHGYLEIDVIRGINLPDMEGWVSKLVDKKDVTDAFIDVRLGKARLAKTSVINNSLNPEWNEDFRIEVCHFAEQLHLEVRDKDHAYAEFIGEVAFATSSLLDGRAHEGQFPIKSKSGSHKGQLELKVKYTSLASIEKTYEVPCYFPMHRNCHVTLYQDAEVPPGLPQFAQLLAPNGEQHNPARCWNDVYYTIMAAQNIICITGWAVWDRLELFRGNMQSVDKRTLGELLIQKANEGVQVYVMVWSEYTSGSVKKAGMMGTHDMETYDRFKNTKVNCARCPRDMEVNEFTDFLQNEFSSGAYTHHQKSIIADTENPQNPDLRRLVAFVGGLDLTGGRYDTPEHELYSTLLGPHYKDFRNNNAKSVPETQGPREPWHDIHSKVEGPVANDVFLNFYERWQKQGKKEGSLSPIDQSKIDIMAPAPQANNDPERAWNVQFFRSITSDSAIFHPELSKQLNSKKGRMVDASIAQAYIQSIRNAENFIYIENQYFLGSAYCWLSNDDTNCNHTIPSEICQKVVDKISQNQRFCAYIMIPMFPEGDPSSAPIQEILYWQTRTIEMMYKRVGEAIAQAGLQSHPTDWLLFMCPGKREAPGEYLNQLESPSEPMAKIFRQSLRFPIYVHSKMMIVDDAYIIVGSANINQRSMAGTRDTEMAVGCWQPAFPEENPYGDVHMFRQSLWAEHMRITDPLFRFPGTIECVAKMKEMMYENWLAYIDTEHRPTYGQCLPYPLNVMPDGSIENLDGIKEFPDFPPGSKIMGKKSAMIPQKVTT